MTEETKVTEKMLDAGVAEMFGEIGVIAENCDRRDLRTVLAAAFRAMEKERNR